MISKEVRLLLASATSLRLGVQVGSRLAEKAHEVHPALQQRAQNGKMLLLRPDTSHYSQFSYYSPLVCPKYRERIDPGGTPSWEVQSGKRHAEED